MPSEIRVVDQKFYYQLRNGDSFSDNTGDFTRHLKGNLLEKVKAVFNVQLSWYEYLNRYNILYNSTDKTLRIESSGTDFLAVGFSVGDTAKYSLNATLVEGEVTSITDGEITLGNTVLYGTPITDGYLTEVEGTDVLTGTTFKQALKYKFGLIENDESFNTLSKLTNTDQIYLVDGMIDDDQSLNFATGKSFGNNKAWVTGSVKSSFVKRVADKDFKQPGTTTQEFQIEHEFIVNPFYRDGDLDSIKGDEIPPLDIFNGDKSLKYVFECEFRTEVNDPNTSMTTEYDTQLGSVGYFDESYNGFESFYSSSNLDYSVNGNSRNQIESSGETNVKFDINSSANNISNGGYVIIGHSSIIESDEYNSSSKTFPNLWNDEKIRVQIGGSNSGGVFNSVDVSYVNSGKISIDLDIDLTSKTTEDGQNYILYYTIEDGTKTPDQSGKVTGLVDVNQYFKNSDINGLWDLVTFEQYPHAEPYDKGVTSGFTNAKGFNETGYFLDSSFLKDNGAELTSLTFEFNIFNTVTSEVYTLRSYDFDLANSFFASGTQQIDVDETRGYILTDDDLFNGVKIETGTNNGSKTEYSIQIGYKTPWQQWLEFKNAPKEFFDKNKSLNGLNQKTSNYSNNVADFEPRVMLRANLLKDGITTEYLTSSENIQVWDYDTDDQNPDAYSCEINTYNFQGDKLENNIIEKEFTELRASFVPINPPTFSESVDFTEVSANWGRFAHGNKVITSSVPRLGDWLHDQANDTDTFTDSVNTFTKNDIDLYTSTQSQILADQNANAMYGCFSNTKYEFYELEGKMFSNEPDDDVIIYNLAFLTDEDGIEHTLSLCVTTGGILLDLNPDYVDGSETISVFTFGNNVCEAALVYNFGKRDCKQLDLFQTPESGYNWNSGAVGDVLFNVNRSEDDFEVGLDWTINGTQYTHTFNYNVNNDPTTVKFKRFQSIGFSFMSQNQGGFKDVILTLATGDYYGILRMESKDSASDFGISELSTQRDASDISTLTQINGDEKKAILSWDGSHFILQGRVDTSKVKEGEDYSFSAELRTLNLNENIAL